MKQRLQWLHRANYFTKLFLLGLFLTPSVLAAQVSGFVFRDFNSSGTRDSTGLFTEPYLSGITVTAYDTTGAVVGTAATGVDGRFSFAIADGIPVRIEFSGFPTGLFPSSFGVSSLTSVQFVTAPATKVHFGLTSTSDYNEYGLLIMTGCFTNGDPLISGSASGPLPAIVGMNYYSKAKKYSALNNQVGSTWGLAHARNKKRLYTSAAVRRHIGFGPNGVGAIYKLDPYNSANSTGLFYDFGASAGTVTDRDLGASLTSLSYDSIAFKKAGKAGIGDIDISTDENTLYAINLADRKLYKIAIDASGNASGNAIEITNAPWLSLPPCTNGTARPWGIKIFSTGSGDKIYVGGICDANGAAVNSVTDLTAWVYEYDVATDTWGITPRLNFSLNFLRQNPGGDNPYGTTFKWKPWTDSYDTMRMTYNSTTQVGGMTEIVGAGGDNYAQPILADIEIDDSGDMILGFLDRGGLQFSKNYTPKAGVTKIIGYTSAGDIMRAGKNADGTWTIENNGVTNGIGGTKTTSSPNPQTVNGYSVTDGGPGGKEFYWGEYYVGAAGTSVRHWETSFGGLAFVPGKNEILLSALDPANTIGSGGAIWINNTNGSKVEGSNLYSGTNLGKSVGITDLETLPGPSINEIGNRIWLDKDYDGIQDAGEKGLVGLTVGLYENNILVGTTITDSVGQYFFNINNVPGGLKNATAYEIRLATNQTAIDGQALTLLNATDNHLDNDASLVSGNAVIAYTTAPTDTIDHSLDIGFIPPCVAPSIASTQADTATCSNSDAAVHVTGISGMVSYAYNTDGSPLYALNATAST